MKIIFQLRIKILQKSSKKQFIVRRNVNDIVFEFQRCFFVVLISIIIELKIKQLNEKLKTQKLKNSKKEKRIK